MTSTEAYTAVSQLDKITLLDWGSYGFLALLIGSLFKSVSMFAQYKKDNSQGDSTAIDRWDNELFSRAIVPLYLRLEGRIVDLLVEEGVEEPSFDERMLLVKKRALERTGIQTYEGVTDFHDALDEIHSKRSNARNLERRHRWNRFYLLAISCLSFAGILSFVGILISIGSSKAIFSVVFIVLFVLVAVSWLLFWVNQTKIDRLQYGKS